MRNLIVFTKEPVQGAVKTRLAATLGSLAALRIAQAMTSDLAHELESFTGKVLWQVDGDPEGLENLIGPDAETGLQGKGGLGERLACAFREQTSRRKGPLGVIGTDCPALSAGILEKLFGEVEGDADVSVIPAMDGGFAALAVKRYVEGIFHGIRWSGPHTLNDLLKNLAGLGLKVRLLAPLSDVDIEEDLTALLANRALKPASRLAAALDALGIGGPTPSVPDDLGRPVPLDPQPGRIISLVPSVTEMLFDLGAGEKVVGRTDFCISPPGGVNTLPSVGGPKSLALDRITSLKPDLVFADAEENTREEVEALIQAGIRVFVALPRTLPDVSSFLFRAGKLLRAEGPMNAAVSDIRELEGKKPTAAVPALCLVWRDPWIAVTDGTLPGALMEAAGFICLAKTGAERYPRLTAGQIDAYNPRVILLPSEPYPFGEGDAGEIGKLFPGASAVTFPGEWVTWYGARTASNVALLSGLAKSAGLQEKPFAGKIPYEGKIS